MTKPDDRPAAARPADETPDDGGRRVPLWLSIVACSLPMFMVALDNLVVSTALHTLAVKLHASTTDLQWFVNAYVLSFACLLLTGAAVGDRFGRRRIFILGIALFTLASVACGLSNTSAELIAARAAEGLGAAAVMPLSLTLLSQAAPPRRRGLALGLWSGISGLAIAMGPVVGGAVVDGLDWQWIFWVNIPVGVIAIPLARIVLRESRLEGVGLDLIGMALAAGALFAVVYGIVHGQSDGWRSHIVLGSFAAGAVLLIAFLVWERFVKQPMLPLSFYTVRAFTLTNIVSASMYFGVFGSLFLLAQYLQIAPPRTPLEAGVRTLAWTLMPMFIAPIAGALTSKVGGGRLMALGLFLQAAGLAWLNHVAGTDTPYSHLVGPMIVAGTGMGFVFAPTAAVVLGSVSPEHAGKASGANTTVREVGGALGIAVLSTIFVGHGSTATPTQFIHGLHPAVWVGVAVVAAGGLFALGIPRRPKPAQTMPLTVAAVEEVHDIRIEEYLTGEAYILRAELPGVDDVGISVQDDLLTVHAERTQKQESATLSEFRYGSFTRDLRLPEHARADDATADYKNGILTVTVPCAEQEKAPTTIDIQYQTA